MNIGIKKI